jgi:phosphonate transport system ATP-binding protein
VICNLHTLDTARAYCRRIIGIQDGKVVFDDRPEALTIDKAREIYGARELDEAMTSTSLKAAKDAAKAANAA